MECSPPRMNGNLSRWTISDATRRTWRNTASIDAYGNSISGSVKMPMLCTSVSVSSSHSSMCDEATRISCGPFRVPATYDVVRSSGAGKTTTRALAKSVVVGVVPPNSASVSRSYSNGRLIHFLETFVGNRVTVDGHDARRHGEHRHGALLQERRGRRRQGADEQRQRDGGIGLHRDFRGVARQFAPALGLFQARSGGAAEVRHVGDDLQSIPVSAHFVAVELGLDAGLIDEVLGRAAAEDDRRGPRAPDDDVRRLDDVADHVDIAGARLVVPRLRQTHADG